jgi:hypothetical protein
MSEVAGFGRLPFPRGGLRTGQLSPGLATAAGPAISAGYLFPAGYSDGVNPPNQALVWSVNVWASDLGVGSVDTPLGAGMQLPTIPGRQYTASCYANQSSANNLYAAVTDLTVADGFNRTTASGWGTADSGGAWTAVGGAGSDYATVFSAAGGVGTHTLTDVDVSRKTVISGSCWDASQVVGIATDALATGAAIDAGVMLRYTDDDNYYYCILFFDVDQSIGVAVVKRVGGAETTIVATTTTLTHTAGTFYLLRFVMPGDGVTFQARVWLAGTPEPTTWDVTVHDDCALNGAGALGAYSILEAGNTNPLPVTVAFASYTASAMAVLGTSVDRPLEWARLSVTFTATQPLHTFAALTIPLAGEAGAAATPLPGVVSCDNVQMEEGAAVSAFTTTGPVIYPVLRGFVERWPRVWSSKGFEGFTQAPCVDALAALTAVSIPTEYPMTVLSLSPDYYWRLDDGADTTLFAETSGNHGPPLVGLVSRYGAGTPPAPGTDMAMLGDPGGTGVTFTADGNGAAQAVTVLGAGTTGTGAAPLLLPATIGASWALSVACWLNAPASFGYTMTPVMTHVYNQQATLYYNPVALFVSDEVTTLVFQNTVGVTNYVAKVIYGFSVTDASPRLVVGNVTQVGGGDTTLDLYVDGGLVGSTTVTTASLGGMLGRQANLVTVGGWVNNGLSQDVLNGAVAHAAVWNRALSADEVSQLSAGGDGFSGDLSGERIERHLILGGYNGSLRISSGRSAMQPATYQGTIDLLTDAQNTTTAEQGNLWVAPDGAFVFEGREERFLRLTSTYTFGEDTAAGELPYLGDVADLELDFDPSFVYPQVSVTRTNAGTAVGGTADAVAAAAAAYFPRSYTADVDLQTDQLVQQMADWVFSTHRAPLLRVSVLTFDPASNPDLWPMVLSVEVGMRVTVIRRAKAANQGQGLTISEDFFVEQVSHDISMAGEWRTQLWCSPVGDATTGSGVTFQPWILGHPIYGVLGSTTVLGW